MVRNDYDPITHYMYEWSKPVISLAVKKGFDVDNVGPLVTKKEILSRIEKLSPDFLFLNGHGSSDCFCGYEDEPVICMPDCGIFRGKMVFSRSCDCAKGLGRKAVDRHGCKAFIGYEYEFINVRLTTSELTPMNDYVSRPIWETSNAVPASLIKGRSVKDAVESSHKKAVKEILSLLLSKETYKVPLLKAIIQNDDGLIYHGDGNASL